jgi:hypothetical protein
MGILHLKPLKKMVRVKGIDIKGWQPSKFSKEVMTQAVKERALQE